MWILKWILVVGVIVVILGFSLQNQEDEQRVYVRIGHWQSAQMPLYFHYFIAFIAGIFVWFVISALQIIQIQSELKSCRRESRQLSEELNALRNLPIEDSSDDLST